MTAFRRLAICFFAGACLTATLAFAQDKRETTGRAIVDPAYHPLNGRRPNVKVPFPGITDWSTLRIRLERTMCFGTCPVYSVEIAGDGRVTYEGRKFVAVAGVRTTRIRTTAVRRLFHEFVKADFFWTFDEYRAHITDLPTTIVTVSFDGRSKSVLDYAGERAGMPKAVADLEEAIDAAAGTERWIGNGERN